MAGTQTTSRSTGLAGETTPNEESSKVGELTSRATDVAGVAAGSLKEHGSELQKTAKSKLTQKADDSRTMAVDKARSVTSDLKDLSSSIREKQPQVADALENVLERGESAIDYLENTSATQLVSELTRQTKQRPLLAVGGMFAAGFLLSRALKPLDGVVDTVKNGTGGAATGQQPYQPTTSIPSRTASSSLQPSAPPVHV